MRKTQIVNTKIQKKTVVTTFTISPFLLHIVLEVFLRPFR